MAYAAMELFTSQLSPSEIASMEGCLLQRRMGYLLMMILYYIYATGFNNAIQNFRQIRIPTPFELLYMEEQYPLYNALTTDSCPHHSTVQVHPNYTFHKP